jgi:NADPH:quinone reductase-like Zn-dependent oxidoreductase
MKAIVQDRYGDADVLTLRDIEPPSAGDDDVIVRVCAAGLDPGVWHLMTGLPYLVRFMGFGLLAPKNPIRGADLAGVVESVGRNVTELRPGDEVYGTCDGSFAELVRVNPRRLSPKPKNLSFEQAAAVPVSGMSALHALRDAGQIRAGERVLIVGAGGGVGAFAVQLAKAFGAHVTGVCSGAKRELVRSLGADEVIDYKRERLSLHGANYDVLIDTAGRRPLSELRRLLAAEGRLVLVGGEGGGAILGGFQRQLYAPLLSAFSSQKLIGLVSQESRADLRELTRLIEAGKLRPVISIYPLSDAAVAVRHLERGHTAGKVVLTV